MAKHSFTTWLQFEVHTARCALLKLIEEEDRLRYIESPRLERQYMEAVGDYEESVVREELECELLAQKRWLVQAAINRREEIDEAAINEKIEALRKDMTADAAGEPPPDYAELSPEQSNELQELYGKIVKEFHPSLHPEMSEAHRELYQKALDAYRHRNLTALKLVWDMLTADDEEELQLAFNLVPDSGDEAAESVPDRDYTTDYSLAADLYASFVPSQEEAAIVDDWERIKEQTSTEMEHLQGLQQKFPFNTRQMLSNPQELAEYRQDLEQRMQQAQREKERLNREIEKMIGDQAKHG